MTNDSMRQFPIRSYHKTTVPLAVHLSTGKQLDSTITGNRQLLTNFREGKNYKEHQMHSEFKSACRLLSTDYAKIYTFTGRKFHFKNFFFNIRQESITIFFLTRCMTK